MDNGEWIQLGAQIRKNFHLYIKDSFWSNLKVQLLGFHFYIGFVHITYFKNKTLTFSISTKGQYWQQVMG